MGASQSKKLAQLLYPAILENDEQRIRAIVDTLKEDETITNLNLPTGPRGEPPIPAAVFHMTDAEAKVSLDTLNLLIELGFDVNAAAEDEFGFTALYTAVRKNKLDIARRLLDAGADANKTLPESRDVPLIFAAAMGYKDMVTLLLQHGADANAPAPGPGGTPLFLTLQSSHVNSLDIAQYLVRHGCDPKKKNEIGRTALHAAAEAMVDVTLCMDFLMDKGLDVNDKDEKNTTPLMLAALTNKGLVCDYLMKHGADLRIQDDSGRTAYDIAVEFANERALNALKPYVTNGNINQ